MKKRRFLSLLLSAALLAGLLTVPASAAGQPYIKQVEAGSPAVMAVLSNGDVYAWGSNGLGLIDRDLRDGGFGWKSVYLPTKILSGVKKVAAPHFSGYFNNGNLADNASAQMGQFILYIKENGELWGMGDNSVFQMGQDYSYGYLDTSDFFSWDTTPVKIMDGVKDVACNGNAGCAITENGDLYFWGVNVAKSTTGGTHDTYTTYTTPTKILSGVKEVDMGKDHILALKEDGTLWGMGCQDDGALCNGKDLSDTPDALQNSMVQLMSGCIGMAAGDHSSYFILSNGDMYACGLNYQSKLGLDTEIWSTVVLDPIKIDSNVRLVEASSMNAYYVKNDNTVWSTGSYEWARRGIYNQDTYDGIIPVIGQIVMSGEIKEISSNGGGTIILKADGTMWGFGSSDQLGTGIEKYPNPATPYDKRGYTWSDIPYVWTPIICGLSTGSYSGMFGPFQEEVELVAGFADIAANAWDRDAVEWAVNEGITSGTGDITFSPDRNCTRAEILTFLWRANGSPSADGDASFDDVAANAYYADAAAWAAEEGIVLGDHLDPDAPCTRAMAVDFLWRANGCPAMALGAPFDDVPEGSPYIGAVEWAVAWNITTGTDEDHFSPDAICNRAQIVTFLYRTYQK